MPKPKKEPTIWFSTADEKEDAIKATTDTEERTKTALEVVQLRYALAEAHNALSSLQMEKYGPQISQMASAVKAAETSKLRMLAGKIRKQEK